VALSTSCERAGACSCGLLKGSKGTKAAFCEGSGRETTPMSRCCKGMLDGAGSSRSMSLSSSLEALVLSFSAATAGAIAVLLPFLDLAIALSAGAVCSCVPWDVCLLLLCLRPLADLTNPGPGVTS